MNNVLVSFFLRKHIYNLQSFVKSFKKKKKLLVGKRGVVTLLTKRQKCIISVMLLSLGLLSSEYFFGKTAILVSILLSICSDILLYWSIHDKEIKSIPRHIFILPFFYSLSFGLFYFLVPARLLTRTITTTLYAIGLYSLFLSQNIFVVSASRSIALLSSARIVSFVITLLSYFFLANIVFSLHAFIVPTTLLIFVCSVFLITHSLWSYTLQTSLYPWIFWTLALSLCLFEISLILWFWPTNPTIIALFLTGFFYTTLGLVHAWLDKRLFRGVLWEYVWVAAIVFCVLVVSTSWGG
ncbi:MAG: hypothetical protein A3F31_03515 [Candidatus Levybacteria bacterium RIFCSPHIGHO2_12_FULL_38_12]|nr:MAG: hypothetical protein A2770_04820 [Candidatus Levybacteria bacterium RIFCSPHIGHO2_01_FULL_38_12]OGH21579.1 MAG: hypothetical protein A3D75_02445 [Candidatus Levybacteria bacterium RIFCSPHIGHO2_02_FULL_37_18]OGH22876.1 MAG: hypothetical protein A3F31_03515 [Candidatus Levybacteria bacterium RIFCSPHIGHO2_12_FULL_38_12]OGH34744.1 MAG: hypothetical protein A3A47_01125 [Candidatus Levybacteria bacterium RIFCSPLOWO2_01_FULL_37_20]OGH43591.1 MAG: hypothetical protein A3J14_03360 [Candidatus Lev